MMNSNKPNGVKPSSEEASLHDQKSGRDFHQPFPDLVTLPMNLIIGLILPFVQDRSTWNNLYLANKELVDAGRTMTPPWPEIITCPPLVQNFGMATVFSPCGHYLASAAMGGSERPSFVNILDRRNGQQTSLKGGHDQNVLCLSFSDDGKYLAGGGNNGLIRIWPANKARKPTEQGLKTLPSRTHWTVLCLAFASDSNLLASGSRDGIKLWNVEDGLFMHSFYHQQVRTSSLVFSGVGESIQCLAATGDGSLIRINWNSSLSEFTSDLVVDGRNRSLNTSFSQCCSFLATLDRTNKLCLYEIKTNGMSMTQSVTLPDSWRRRTNAGMAFSPDNKILAVLGDTSREGDTAVRLLDMEDLTLQRQFKWQLSRQLTVSLALDPSSRYLATASSQGTIRLWTF
jgi:WD40 repeat protein